MRTKLFVDYIAPYKCGLIVSTILMVFGSLAALAVPWFAGLFLGSLFSSTYSDLKPLLAVILILFVARAVFQYVSAYWLSAISLRILADMRVRIYNHLQALPLGFFQERRQGDLLALLTYEISQLNSFVSGTLLSIIPKLVLVCGSVVLMLKLDIKLALMVTVLVPIFFLIVKVLGRKLRPLATELQQAYAAAMATADENLGMLPAIKVFTRESIESAKYREQVHKIRRIGTKQQRIYAAMQPILQLIMALAIVLLLWLATDRITSQVMTGAELFSFLLYAALLASPVGSLAGVYGQIQTARGTLGRFQQALQEKPEPILETGPALNVRSGKIEFRNIEFAYLGREAVLNGVNLEIAANETVAITGENGSGKSTLIHLLMRLHQLQKGQILIDGVDIANVSLGSLRKQIGMVSQQVLLFNGNVRDNIGFGMENADQNQIEAAARTAQAHEFIAKLPDGYDTFIGDDGIKLSGGQRQRIALARALLKNPPILVLDEATAMFDPEGERSFIQECRNELQNRTVILITHRPASLALADRIVRVEKGKIVNHKGTELHSESLHSS